MKKKIGQGPLPWLLRQQRLPQRQLQHDFILQQSSAVIRVDSRLQPFSGMPGGELPGRR
ncbi:hypothetical protein [uncultured Sphingomonas sp.]|uniref:hypothetical protein n=1 Tax=uncultured Sphingomonas sp. TaxID=158754 RepID=UPI0025FE2401|nr:hypothetical protein [uncultured Sphingomonas sp.]